MEATSACISKGEAGATLWQRCCSSRQVVASSRDTGRSGCTASAGSDTSCKPVVPEVIDWLSAKGYHAKKMLQHIRGAWDVL